MTSFPEEINTPFNYTINKKHKSSKKNMPTKNSYLIILDDNTIENKLFKKINKYNISNVNKYEEKIRKNIINDYYIYDHRTNIYPNINLSNDINLNPKLKKSHNGKIPDNNNNKIKQKTNSIKNFFFK